MMSAGRTSIPPSVTDAGIGAMRSTVSSRATRAASLCARSISERSPGADYAHKAETLLSALKVMSRPAERRSLPALRVSRSPPVFGRSRDTAGGSHCYRPCRRRKSEQALRIEPDAIRFFARRVVLVGMAEGALALQVIRGRGRLGEGRYHGQARRSLPNSTRPGETILLLPKAVQGALRRRAGRTDRRSCFPLAERAHGAEKSPCCRSWRRPEVQTSMKGSTRHRQLLRLP